MRVRARGWAPGAVTKPAVELLPSAHARYPRSLTHWNPVQMVVEAWPRPDTSPIWSVVVQRTVRTNFPGHELRGLKPRVGTRALDSPILTCLPNARMLILSPRLH